MVKLNGTVRHCTVLAGRDGTRVELLFHNATYGAKFLWRDDLVAARHCTEAFMLQADFLPMLEWHSEIEHGRSVKPGPYGRRLKRWVRPDLWAELEKTCTGPDLDANWDAMFRLIDLLRKMALEVGEHLGFTYPHAMDQRATAYLQRVPNLARDAETFSQGRRRQSHAHSNSPRMDALDTAAQAAIISACQVPAKHALHHRLKARSRGASLVPSLPAARTRGLPPYTLC